MVIVGLWSTNLCRVNLKMQLLVLLSVGNIFTAYLIYLDVLVVKAFTLTYVALYCTNYALTGLVVAQYWRNDVMDGFVYGTVTGAVIGILFGPYGVAACGIAGGMFGAVRNYMVPKKPLGQNVSAARPELVIDCQTSGESRCTILHVPSRNSRALDQTAVGTFTCDHTIRVHCKYVRD